VAGERKIEARDPDKPSATGRAMDELNGGRLNNYLNAAPALLDKLEEAQLIEDVADTWEGQPVRRLTFKVTPPLNERSRKIIKGDRRHRPCLDWRGWTAGGGREPGAAQGTGPAGDHV